MRERREFDTECAKPYLEILQKIAAEPPSADSIDPVLVQRIQKYLDTPEEKTPVSIWNFYKEVLDLIVYSSGASGFFIRLFDLEPVMKAPEGAFSQEDGSISKAPWRDKLK